MLSELGVVTGANPPPAAVTRTDIDDQPIMDSTLLDPPTQTEAIDFERIALSQTTEIEVPERLDHDFEYLVTRFERAGEDGYFQVEIIPRRSLRKLQTMPKDIIFLLDTSASIPQTWVTQMIAGTEFGLRTLNKGDRFNIVLFSENPRFFSTKGPKAATQANIDKSIAFLKGARSEGYTDVNAALSQLMKRDVQQERVYELVFMTDGKPTRGLINTRDLINIITRDNDLNASIYCVGVGEDPNLELLEFLAYRNKGFCVFVDKRTQVATTIRDLMSRLRYPLIKNVRLSVAGVNEKRVFPLDLPNIHQGERFYIYGRYDTPGIFTMQVTGTSAGKKVDFTFTRDLRQAPGAETNIRRSWAFWKLHHRYSEMIRRGETQELRDQIEQIGKRYGLRTLY